MSEITVSYGASATAVRPQSSIHHAVDAYRHLHDLSWAGSASAALDTLNKRYSLYIDPLSLQAMSLVMGALFQVEHFSEHKNIAASCRGSIGQHSLMVLPVVEALYALAFDGQRPTLTSAFNPVASLGKELADLQREQMLGALVRNWGEVFGERSQLGIEKRHHRHDKLMDVERVFAEFAYKLAFRCVLDCPDQPLAQARKYDGIVGSVRQAVELRKAEPREISRASLSNVVIDQILQLEDQHHLSDLSPHVLSRVDTMMSLYDKVSGLHKKSRHTPARTIVQYAGDVQSIMHIAEHAGQDGAPPYSLATSREVGLSLWSVEHNVPAMYAQLDAANILYAPLAQAMARFSYGMNVVLLETPTPPVIDRAALLHSESDPDNAAGRGREIEAALARWQSAARKNTDFSRPELHRDQLSAAYRAALHVAGRDPAYTPPTKVLARLTELPPVLVSAMSRRVSENPLLPDLRKMVGRSPAFVE